MPTSKSISIEGNNQSQCIQNKMNYSNSGYNFYSNQANHIERVKDKVFNLRLQKINGLEEECTFTPKINQTYNQNYDKSPRFLKLNQDANIHKRNLIELKLKIEKENEEKNPRYPRNARSSNHLNINDNGFRSKYYNKLYRDAFQYESKKKENYKKAYADYTFKPNFTNNPKYKVNSNFYERRNKSIEDKIQRIKKKEEEEKEEIEKQKKSKPKKEKIEETNKYVIDKLYKQELEKIKEKKLKEEQDEKKKEKKKKNRNIMKVVYKRTDKNNKETTLGNNTLNDVINDNNIQTNNDSLLKEDNPNEPSELLIDKIKNDHVINFKKNQPPLNNSQLKNESMINQNANQNDSSITQIKDFIQIKSLSEFSPIVDESHDKSENKEEPEKQPTTFQSQSLQNLLGHSSSPVIPSSKI